MFCTEFWPNPSSRRIYTMIVMLAQFFLPFVCMAYCYSKIFGVLNQRAKVSFLFSRRPTIQNKLRKMDERSFALEQTCVIRSTSTDNLDKKATENGENTVSSYVYISALISSKVGLIPVCPLVCRDYVSKATS